MSLVVAVLESDGVLGCPACVEHFLNPVRFLRVVVVNAVGFAHGLHVIARHLFVLNPVFCTEQFGCLAKTLVDSLKGVCHFGTSVCAAAGLCRDEDNAVTCLGTVDCSRSGIFQDFHRFNHGGVEVLDVVNLQTIDNQ